MQIIGNTRNIDVIHVAPASILKMFLSSMNKLKEKWRCSHSFPKIRKGKKKRGNNVSIEETTSMVT